MLCFPCLQFLFLEERWRRHPFFVQAAAGMARCWLRLYLNPSLRDDGSKKYGGYTQEEWDALPPGEKKKAKQKMKREQMKKKKAEEANQVPDKDKDESDKPTNKKVDEDAEGKLYLKEEEPLQKAYTLSSELVKYAPDVAESQALAAHVASLRQKPLQAIKHLKAFNSTEGDVSHLSPGEIAEAVRNCIESAQKDGDLSETTLEVIKEHNSSIDDTIHKLKSLSL